MHYRIKRILRRLGRTAPLPLRALAARVMPLPSRLHSPNVSQASTRELQPDVLLRVYWLGERLGPGPGASLVIKGDEVMRFDCLGESLGHMHFNLKQCRSVHGGTAARLYFHETSIEAQIERSCFELEYNLSYALQTNIHRAVRRIRLSREDIAEGVCFMRRTMKRLLAQNRPPPGQPSPGTPAVEQAAPKTLDI